MTDLTNETDEARNGGSELNGGVDREANKNAALMPCGTAVTNVYDAYAAGAKAEREACAMLLDDDADRQECCWNEYVASGKQGPATSFHNIPRGYADAIRKRSN